MKIMTRRGLDGEQILKVTGVESFFKLFQPIQPPKEGTVGINEYEEMKEVRPHCVGSCSW